MSIRPVDFNGMLQRTTDVGAVKQHEDAKPLVDQQNSQNLVQKHEDQLSHQVIKKDDSEMMDNDADAKEEGKGQYFDSKHLKKKKKETKEKEDKVIPKSIGGGFDIKI